MISRRTFFAAAAGAAVAAQAVAVVPTIPRNNFAPGQWPTPDSRIVVGVDPGFGYGSVCVISGTYAGARFRIVGIDTDTITLAFQEKTGVWRSAVR